MSLGLRLVVGLVFALSCGSAEMSPAGGGGESGGDGGPSSCEPAKTASFASVQKILAGESGTKGSCALSTACHQGSGGKAGLTLEAMVAYEELVGKDGAGEPSCEFPEMKRVAPGKPQESLLYLKLTTPPMGEPAASCRGTGGKNQRMPMSGSALPCEQIAVIRKWIEDGAKAE